MSVGEGGRERGVVMIVREGDGEGGWRGECVGGEGECVGGGREVSVRR